MAINIDELCGWVHNPQAVDKLLSKLPFPIFGDAAPHLKDTGADKDVFLWDAEQLITNAVRPPHKQTIGDCVSHGFSGAIDDLRFVRMAWSGLTEDFIETASEAIYGGARVEIGHRQCGQGDGACGAWAVEWITKFGVLQRKKYDHIDLTTYSGNLAKNWGWNGLPPELELLAKEYPVKSTSLIQTYEELRDAIATTKCPVVVSSNQGFTLTRDKYGFCAPQGSWGHCTYFRGVSDNPRRPGAVYQQSWGEGMPSGSRDVETYNGSKITLPEGAFFVDAEVINRMLAMGDSYVISDMVGYVNRDFTAQLY